MTEATATNKAPYRVTSTTRKPNPRYRLGLRDERHGIHTDIITKSHTFYLSLEAALEDHRYTAIEVLSDSGKSYQPHFKLKPQTRDRLEAAARKAGQEVRPRA